MPFRNMSDTSLLVTPRAFNDTENNVFDKAFNNVIDMEEWADWVKWEGNNTDMIFPMMDRRESVASSISSPETWSMSMESCNQEKLLSTSYTQDTTINMDDAPFEFEDTNPGNDMIFSRTAMTTRSQQEPRRSVRGFSSLTEAEERQLQAIAMPYQALSNIKISSSRGTSISSPSPSPSVEPEAPIRKTRKRKSVTDEEIPSALCLSRKRGHNAIEKRYRTNLNDKINLLREALPMLQRTESNPSSKDEDEDSDNENENRTNHPKCGKAATLTRALEYIKHLETATQRLGNETNIMQTRIGAFEKLAMGGSMVGVQEMGIGMAQMQKGESATLESIQNDFNQAKARTASIAAAAATKRRGANKASKA